MWGDAYFPEQEPSNDDWEIYNSDAYNPSWDTVGDVAAQFACPLCGNRDADSLLLPDWGDGDDVRCEACGLWYKLED